MSERERERERDTDRQTDRQTDRETERALTIIDRSIILFFLVIPLAVGT